MQVRFPYGDEAWRRQVEQLLMQLCVDRDRLMQTTPQIPDPEAGIAFNGPLAPAAFAFRGGGGPPGSGSTPVSGHFAASGTANTGS